MDKRVVVIDADVLPARAYIRLTIKPAVLDEEELPMQRAEAVVQLAPQHQQQMSPLNLHRDPYVSRKALEAFEIKEKRSSPVQERMDRTHTS